MFSKTKCEISDNESNHLAVGQREGNLYYLDHAQVQSRVVLRHNLASQIRLLGGSRNARVGQE